MRTMQGILSANPRKSPAMALAFLCAVVIGAYEVSDFILAGNMAGLAYAGMAVVVAAFVVSMLTSWRRGVYILFAWLLFEDFARKYLGNNMAIYFAKDLLAAVVYLSFFLDWRRRKAQGFRPPFLVPLMLMVWFGVLQVFNPASPSYIYGLLGIKLFFYYIPLLLVGYALMDSELELRRLLKVNLVLIMLIAGLGIVQSIIGPTFLNPSVMQEDIRELSNLYRVAPISGLVVYRPTSVFVSTGRYVDLLNVAWLITLGFIGYALLRFPKGRLLGFFAASFVAAGITLSASRGAFAWGLIHAIAAAAAFLWGAPWRQGEVRRILRTIFRIGLGIGLAILLLMFTFPDALLGRLAVYSETMSPDSPTGELGHRARDYPILAFVSAFNYERWPYGYGIGTTALGTQYVSRIIGVKPVVVGVESGFGAIVVEMGIVGLALWLVMTAAILFSAWRVVKRLRGSTWFPLGFVIFFYAAFLLIPQMIGGIQAYEDFVLNAYLWLLLGVLFRLPQLKAAAEVKAAEQSLTAQPPRWVT